MFWGRDGKLGIDLGQAGEKAFENDGTNEGRRTSDPPSKEIEERAMQASLLFPLGALYIYHLLYR